MNDIVLRFLTSLLLLAPLSSWAQRQPDPGQVVSKIALGSCAHQNKPQPILTKALSENPDLFLYLGDNIYGDTRDMADLQAKYDKLGAKPEFKKLCQSVPILATWDDHDYGENDAGREYPFKTESRDIFLNFWNEPEESERRSHDGIYHAVVLGPPGKRVQVILLDTRSFRDGLLEKDGKPWKNDYRPNESPDSTFLGAEQWAWLGKVLQERAEVRIVVSSNQFSHDYNGWESWTNVPREREKMQELIVQTRARGVFFLSGDVHWGELSRLKAPGCYPLYDLTSSGITQTWPSTEPNSNRIGKPVRENNFGLISIDWEKKDPEITFELKNKKGDVKVRHQVSLSELSFPGEED